jgi:lysophospholipase
MSKELKLTTDDGLGLYARIDVPTNPKAVLVVVHGLAEHSGRYDYLTERLNAQGIAVYRFDHRGHGRSEGKRVFYSDYREIAHDTRAAVDQAKAELPGLPTFVLGHSMGGYAATLFGTIFAGMVDGILLSGALTRGNKNLFGDLPDDIDPETYVPNTLGDGVCSDPAVGIAYEADPLVEKQISVGLMKSLQGGLEFLKSDAAKFTDPTLIMHGADDGLVAEKDSRELYGEIGSTDKGLIIYPGMMHEILNEFHKDYVIDDILRWLNPRM